MTKILAIDPGLGSMGVVVFEKSIPLNHWLPIEMRCLKTSDNKGVQNIRASHDLLRRAAEQVRELNKIRVEHGIKCVVSEMYDTAAQSAAALRLMMITLGMLGAWVEDNELAAEWYSPWDTRRAAGVPSSAHGPAVKNHVIAAMGKLYPRILEFPKNQGEHIADACSVLEAARGGVLMRSL